jgi:acylphosphatase
MRLEARFTGRVQGVGFRYATSRIARHYDVVGYVRNMPDGSVEVIVEGNRGLSEFLNEVTAVMGARVDQVQRQEAEPSGEFESFEIRF